jgi:hypothetical protein
MAGGVTNGIRGYNFNEGMFNDNGLIGTVAEFIETGITPTVSAIDFALPANYLVIDFIFNRFSPTSGGQDIHIQLSDDGGATFKTGATDYRYSTINIESGTANNTFLSTNSNGDSKILVATNLVATAAQSSRFTVRVMGHPLDQIGNAGATTIQAIGVKSTSVSGPPMGIIQSYGRRNASETHNAIRFIMSSGTVNTGYLVVGYRDK